MFSINFISILAIISATAFASPIGDETKLLEVRTNGNDCAGVQYSNVDSQSTYDEAIGRLRAGEYAYYGQRAYPELFRNGRIGAPEVDPNPCEGLELYEFPIIKGGLYNGGFPGADRVVVGRSDSVNGAWHQCFLMTHNGAPGNLFVRCT